MPSGSARKPVGSQDVFLQQEGAPNYALLVNIAPGVALAVDVTDRAGRLLGIVYGENDQLQQLTPADAAAPNESLEVTGFNMIYDAVADDWNRWIQSATEGVPLVEDTGTNMLPALYPPASDYFQDDGGGFPDWAALAIGAGDITLGVDVTGYTNKTICFISDTEGTLTIEILEPDAATWRAFDVIGIPVNTMRSYKMEEQTEQVRIQFSAAATVSAWITTGVA